MALASLVGLQKCSRAFCKSILGAIGRTGLRKYRPSVFGRAIRVGHALDRETHTSMGEILVYVSSAVWINHADVNVTGYAAVVREDLDARLDWQA